MVNNSKCASLFTLLISTGIYTYFPSSAGHEKSSFRNSQHRNLLRICMIGLINDLLYIPVKFFLYYKSHCSPITKLLANDLSVFTLQNNRIYFHFNALPYNVVCNRKNNRKRKLRLCQIFSQFLIYGKSLKAGWKEYFCLMPEQKMKIKKNERKEIGKKVYFFVKWILKCMDDCYP